MKRRPILIFITLLVLISSPPSLAENEWADVSLRAARETGEYSDAASTLEEKLKQKINLDYKEADLANVLRSLSWTYGLNIVTSADVKGRVTINLVDIPVMKALEAILTLNGLAYSIRDGIIYISSGDTNVVELTSEVIFLKYMRAADAQNILRKVLSAKGDLKIDEVTNMLVITDYMMNIMKFKKLLKKVDIPPKQVLIEAKIVDITSTDLKMLGITWDYDLNPGHGILEESTDANERLKSTVSMPERSADLTGGQLVLDTLTMKSFSVTATIDALARDGKANLLASPSIAVLNGEEARIIIGERYPYKERTQTATGTTETTKFVDIGTTLRVTPQINDDGYITMRLHPEVSTLAEALDAGPRVTTREADTTVRVKEGETLVIGGLIRQQDESVSERIPILGDLPLIGYLFTRNDVDAEQKELAVFITPTILRSREEKMRMSKEDADKEDAYIILKKTGELHIVENLYSKARRLDKGRGLVSWRKDKSFRKTQALSLYEHVYYQYPDSIRASEALYYAAEICFYYLKDYKKAQSLLTHLVSDYPHSQYKKKAQRGLRKAAGAIERERKRQKREREREKRRRARD
ncbi:MAG: hypothetical protein ISS34_06335 [Candidatus Omnitrophica bacterium]|nr:hypothetical protein [Candidatus Omnitrophota bacterium]